MARGASLTNLGHFTKFWVGPKIKQTNWAQKGPGPKFGPWPLWGPAAGAEGLRIRRTPQVVQGVSDSRVHLRRFCRFFRFPRAPPLPPDPPQGYPPPSKNHLKIRPPKMSTFELQTVSQQTPNGSPKSSKSCSGGLPKGVLEKVSKKCPKSLQI